MEVSNKDFAAYLAEALLKEAKFQIRLSRRHAGLDFAAMTTSKLAKTKHLDTARERVRRAAYNDLASSANDCWFINPTIIQELVGVRYQLIADYVAEHQSEVDALNAKHQLTPRHNHKRARSPPW